MEASRKILNELKFFFGIQIDPLIIDNYIRGHSPNLLDYEKLDDTSSPLTGFEKYLIGYESYILYCERKPVQFYDIYRSCRYVIMLEILHSRISVLEKIKNFQPRAERLVKAKTYDEFESVLFELIVASKYAAEYGSDKVEFLLETQEKQPDFVVNLSEPIYVECKKMNRSIDEASEIRNKIRQLHLDFARSHTLAGRSALLGVQLTLDPSEITQSEWNIAFEKALSSSDTKPTVCRFGEITKEPLSPETFKDLMLFPSPAIYLNRYKFDEGNPWHGLVHSAEFNFAQLKDSHHRSASTILDSIRADITLRWAASEDLNERVYRRTNFGLIFKGLKQLEKKKNTVLHFCFERDSGAGHRRDNLLKLFNSMKEKGDVFGWLILNELHFLVSPEGRFDLQEHAHPISGLAQFTKHPPISCVYADPLMGDYNDSTLFGIGHILPDIDTVQNNSTKPKSK